MAAEKVYILYSVEWNIFRENVEGGLKGSIDTLQDETKERIYGLVDEMRISGGNLF